MLLQSTQVVMIYVYEALALVLTSLILGTAIGQLTITHKTQLLYRSLTH